MKHLSLSHLSIRGAILRARHTQFGVYEKKRNRSHMKSILSWPYCVVTGSGSLPYLGTYRTNS